MLAVSLGVLSDGLGALSDGVSLVPLLFGVIAFAAASFVSCDWSRIDGALSTMADESSKHDFAREFLASSSW